MKLPTKSAGLFFILILTSFSFAQSGTLKYGTGKWNQDSLGNHRAVVELKEQAFAAHVIIPWRRNDLNPEKKRIIVCDGATGKRIANFKNISITRESGDLVFEPVSGPGIYYVYYMPFKSDGKSNYPNPVYLEPAIQAPSEWINSFRFNTIAMAQCTEIQSIDGFNSFYPMEVIATAKETENIIKASNGATFIVFPEEREYPIKMDSDLPQRWIERENNKSFTGRALKGENFTYQLGIFAVKKLDDLKIKFSDLKNANGKVIPAKNINCFNTGGINYDSKPFTKKIDVEAGKIQPLWVGVDIPTTSAAGIYKGSVLIQAGKDKITVPVNIEVGEGIIADGGTNEPWKQTRLKWLNSTLAQKNDVIAPYIPLEVKSNVISLLGRKLKLSPVGLPLQIESFVSEEMTSYVSEPKEIINGQFQFIAETENGKIEWVPGKFKVTKTEPGTVNWESGAASSSLSMKVKGSLEFDGFGFYEIVLTAVKDIDLKDVRLEIPFNKDAAPYMMGLGQKGGLRPNSLSWKWDVANKNQDGAWIGSVNAGLQFTLRDENYIRPLNTNFYLQKPLLLPSSWGNNGNGGISILEDGNSVIVKNYCGPRKMKKGETLNFNFTLIITPFHTLNTDFQWDNRFFHSYKPVDTVKASGATIVNIHHANEINPYINYPFIAHKEMKSYIDEAHSKGLKVKIYNTVRELSNRAHELYPLRSLGTEIFSAGNGGGFEWLQEHLGKKYIAAWFVPELKDAAIINSGMSRWHNYYVEGMNWLVNSIGIDGIYLDDVAFDRVTMKRIKRVLNSNGHPGIIDLHSANQYNKRDGFINSAMLYMEHFPYLNKLWFGEYFDYENNTPDFFLTEVSGIPFGLMGEMLQGGGNPWRGMVFGITNRMPWSDNADPRPIWKAWDDFGIKGSRMIGCWVSDNPVKTGNKEVAATVYKKNSSAMVSIASWAKENVKVKLNIDFKILGINPDKAVITAPAIKNFQPAREFKPDDEIPVEKGKGWLLIIKEK